MKISRAPVIITGMYASGYQLLGNWLSSAGLFIDTNLLTPQSRRRSRSIDDDSFASFQQRLLQKQLAVFAEPYPAWPDAKQIDDSYFTNETIKASAREFLHYPPTIDKRWGWQDHQTTFLLDMWQELLPDAPFLLVYRFPWEVANSVQRHGATNLLLNPEYLYQTWLSYNRRLLDFYQRHRERCLLININGLWNRHEKIKDQLIIRFGLPMDDSKTMIHSDRHSAFAADDPLIALLAATSPDCIELLQQLESVADFPAQNDWQIPTINQKLRRPDQVSSANPAKLSIVIPCFNYGEYLLEAIASCERHAPAGSELIIVNDGSTDARTKEILKILAGNGYYIANQPQSGVSKARNYGIDLAQGEYIFLLDADDRIRADFLQQAIQQLNANPKLGVVYGDFQTFGTFTYRSRTTDFDLNLFLCWDYVLISSLFRKQVWLDCQGFDLNLQGFEDWEFWMNAAKQGWQFHYLPQVAFDYRVKPQSLSAECAKLETIERFEKYVREKHASLYQQYWWPRLMLAAHPPVRSLIRIVTTNPRRRERLFQIYQSLEGKIFYKIPAYFKNF